MSVFEQILVGSLIGSIPVILAVILTHWASSLKTEKREHASDIRRNIQITLILKEYALHSHEEKHAGEALTTDGIRYPKIQINGGNG